MEGMDGGKAVGRARGRARGRGRDPKDCSYMRPGYMSAEAEEQRIGLQPRAPRASRQKRLKKGERFYDGSLAQNQTSEAPGSRDGRDSAMRPSYAEGDPPRVKCDMMAPHSSTNMPPVNLSQMSLGGSRRPQRGGSFMEDSQEEFITRPEHVVNKTGRGTTNWIAAQRALGSAGRRFNVVSNLFKLNRKPTFHMYLHHVDFEPDVPNKGMRQGMIAEHTDIFGDIFEFDGMLLFLPKKLDEPVTRLTSLRKTDNTVITIQVKFTNEIDPTSTTCLQLFNITFKKLLGYIDMKPIGRNYYSPSQAVYIRQHKLEVWPGFVTSILQFEESMMLIADLSHKILHTETALEVMCDLYKRQQRNFHEACTKKLVGQIVLTRYNNKTYRIDDIDWNGSPKSLFKKADGGDMTFVEYFQSAHGLTVHEMDQPLLLSNPKAKDLRRGQDGPLIFLPELCYLTGLSEEVRADYNVMKEIAVHTRIEPAQRVRTLEGFIAKIHKNPQALKQLNDWNLDFAESLLSMVARQVPQEVIKQRDIAHNYNSMLADWSREMKNRSFIDSKDLDQWIVVVTQRDVQLAEALIDTLCKICPPTGVNVKRIMPIQLQDDQTSSFVRALRENVTRDTKMVVCILPSNRSDRYNAIKLFTCIENPVPSQVVLARTLSKSNMLVSVATKIAIQLNCKMGGEIWAVDIPLKDLMVVGIDCYHDSSKKGHSVGAFVASFNKSLTRYYSRCALQSNMQELMDSLNTFMRDALKYYQMVNGTLPATIVVYRDGVGDGQLQTVHAYEVKQLQECFRTVPGYEPKFVFIVVKKRINSRFFSKTDSGIANPPPGTIVDSVATRPVWYDFFMVSQSVRQGTVAPTHYNIIHDSSSMTPDHQQRLAYKLCHLYYNWPGTIRVPAPCQYAHKLAFLVGQSLHREAANKLFDRLYYL